MLYGLRRSLTNMALMLGSGALIYRGLTGYCAAYQALEVNTAHHDTGHGVALRATIMVNKPAAEVYRFWRHLENHPRFMQHLESVVSHRWQPVALGGPSVTASARRVGHRHCHRTGKYLAVLAFPAWVGHRPCRHRALPGTSA